MTKEGRISIRLVQVKKIIGAEWWLASSLSRLTHLVPSSSCARARPCSRSLAAWGLCTGHWPPECSPPRPPGPSWSRLLSDHSYSPGNNHCAAWAPRPSAAWAGAGWLCTRGGRRTRRWCRRSPSTRSRSDPRPENWVGMLFESSESTGRMFCYSWKVCLHCHVRLARHCVDTLGLFVCIVLWMLIRTRKIVTSSVIRPGIISGFTRKLKIEVRIKTKWDSRPAERGTQVALSVLSTQFKTETKTKINWNPEDT